MPKQCQNKTKPHSVYSTNTKMSKNRIVNNSVLTYGCSSNWRADYHKYKGSSYAQVLKLAPRGSTVSNVTKVQLHNQRVKTKPAIQKGQVVPPRKKMYSGNIYQKSVQPNTTYGKANNKGTSTRFEILSSLQSMEEESEPTTCVSDKPDAIGSTRPYRVKKTGTPVKCDHTIMNGDTIYSILFYSVLL